jgi:hypothetical protein
MRSTSPNTTFTLRAIRPSVRQERFTMKHIQADTSAQTNRIAARDSDALSRWDVVNVRTLCEIAEIKGDSMKKIWTDFNGPNPNKLRISNLDMEYFKHSDGEIVIIYTEDIQVEARIMYDDGAEN